MKREHLAYIAVGFLAGRVARTATIHLVYLSLIAVVAISGFYFGAGG